MIVVIFRLKCVDSLFISASLSDFVFLDMISLLSRCPFAVCTAIVAFHWLLPACKAQRLPDTINP